VSKSAKPSTGALYGTWVAPLIGHVDVPALLARLPTRLPTLQSLVEFLGTGGMLHVIEQKGTHYYLTGPGIAYTEITETVERIRSDLMRGLDEQSRKQMAAKGAAGVYRIRSADVTIYRYGARVREPWRLGHTQVPNLATHEFSSANMWVREIGAKGDRVHVEPANAEAEGVGPEDRVPLADRQAAPGVRGGAAAAGARIYPLHQAPGSRFSGIHDRGRRATPVLGRPRRPRAGAARKGHGVRRRHAGRAPADTLLPQRAAPEPARFLIRI